MGKSSIVRKVADHLGLKLFDIRAALKDPVDFLGVPSVEGGITRWNPPDFLPHEENCLIFLDELPQAVPAVQSCLLQLCLDKRIGNYILPKNCYIVAAGNRTQDRAGANKIITPLLNRFAHLDFDIKFDDWSDWAISEGISPKVFAYLNTCKDRLFQFNPENGEKSFPTPRSWEFLSKILKSTGGDNWIPGENEDGLYLEVCSSAIGKGEAAQFIGFLRRYGKIPTPEEILENPNTAKVSGDIADNYAILSSLAYHISNSSSNEEREVFKGECIAYCEYLLRLKEEMMSFGLSIMLRNTKIKDDFIRFVTIQNTGEKKKILSQIARLKESLTQLA